MRTDRKSPGTQGPERQARPSPRIDLHAVGGVEILITLQRIAKNASVETLDTNLIHLVRVRVLQLIGGPLGEQQGKATPDVGRDLGRKIACLLDWYTSRAFSAREKAALMWAEDLVYADRKEVSDVAYADAAKEFTPGELWGLATVVAATQAWTMMAHAFHFTDLGLSPSCQGLASREP